MTVEDRKKKILILTADAGFGHRSAANAIMNSIRSQYAEFVTVEIVNPLNHPDTPVFLRDTQSDYDVWVKNVPELYRFGYDFSDGIVTTTILERILTFFLAGVMGEILVENQPDIIVSTYPLYQAPLHSILLEKKSKIPIITVLTDLATLHLIWFYPAVDLIVVPNNHVKQLALESGFKPEKIFVCGIPINTRIYELKDSKKQIREELGWLPDIVTVICMGSSRTDNFEPMLNILNHSGFEIQLILIAGKDKKLFELMNEMEWHKSVFIYEFVDDMPKFLNGADLIMCKAGGLTVTESMAAGLAMLLVDVIPGQETGNAEFVEEINAGFWIKSPTQLLEEFCHISLNDFALLNKMQKNASAASNPLAAEQLAHRIYRILEEE